MDITLDQLKDMTNEELLEVGTKNMEETPKMTVIYKDTDKMEGFEEQIEYTFDYIKKFIECDKVNGILTAPFIDEREIPIFKKVVFSKKGRADRIPWEEYFNVVRVESKNELFGIVTNSFDCLKINRKDDPRFPNDIRNDKKEEKMYYLYEEKMFMQVPDKRMKPNEEGAEEHNKPFVEFDRRKEMKDYIKVRLKKLTHRYLEAFDVVYELEIPGQQKRDLLHFYKEWNHFFSEEMKQGMQLALIYNRISLQEYKIFIKVVEKYQPIIKDKYELLKTAEINDKGEVEKEFYQKELEEVTLFLRDFINEREENNEKNGFFVWKMEDGTKVINPTISEVERRKYYMDFPSKPDDEKRKNEAVIEYLTDKEEGRELRVIEKPAALEKGDYQVILSIIKDRRERDYDTSLFISSIIDKSKISSEEIYHYIDQLVEERNRKERE